MHQLTIDNDYCLMWPLQGTHEGRLIPMRNVKPCVTCRVGGRDCDSSSAQRLEPAHAAGPQQQHLPECAAPAQARAHRSVRSG